MLRRKGYTRGGIEEEIYSSLQNLWFSGEKRGKIPVLKSYLRSLILRKAARVGGTRLAAIETGAEGVVALEGRGIDEGQTADLRARLRTFAEDWERPEMEAYS